MKCLIPVCLACISGYRNELSAQKSDPLKDVYDAKRLFDLRDAVERGTASAFYQAAVDSSLNRTESAAEGMHSFLETAPSSSAAYQAHDLLGNMYFRNGRYAEAYSEIVAALKENPDGPDAKEMLGIVTALNGLPSMSVVSLRPDGLRIEPGSIFLPLQLEGKAASLFFDTGASISLLGQSLANSLGLVPKRVQGTLGDASGRGVGDIRVAVVRDLTIGTLQLRNVPFLIVEDGGPPWADLPTNKRGILGLPVLLAMRTLRWSPQGSFAFGFPGRPLRAFRTNMLFLNSNPVIDVEVSDRRLAFTLDTGAVDTDLNPAFATAFPRLIKNGKAEKRSIEGLGGAVEGDSVLLPAVSLVIGGRTAILKPAHVFLDHGNGTWAAGNLGMDVLRQAHSFTLDFGAMILQLQ